MQGRVTGVRARTRVQGQWDLHLLPCFICKRIFTVWLGFRRLWQCFAVSGSAKWLMQRVRESLAVKQNQQAPSFFILANRDTGVRKTELKTSSEKLPLPILGSNQGGRALWGQPGGSAAVWTLVWRHSRVQQVRSHPLSASFASGVGACSAP